MQIFNGFKKTNRKKLGEQMIDRACISITSKCQLRCTYCHFDKHISKTSCGDITAENLEVILKNILLYARNNELKAFKVGLVGAGEPLLRFDLIQIAIGFSMENDSEHILQFYTISNGVGVNEEILLWFYEHKDTIKLSFSLDGNESIQDSCRKFPNGKGTYFFVMKNINSYKKIFGVAPSVNTTVHKKSIENEEELLTYFEQTFSEVCFSRLVDEASPDLYISKSDFNSFIERAGKTTLSLRQLRKPPKYDCTMYGQLCGVGRTNIFYANGKVYPCGRFIGMKEYELGNETDSLETIYKSMLRFTPVKDGKCYFDEIQGGK